MGYVLAYSVSMHFFNYPKHLFSMDNLSKRLLQASCALALTAAVTTSAQAQSTRKDLQTGNKLFNQETTAPPFLTMSGC